MKIVNMREAKARLSQLVEAVEAGEEVTIARAGRAVARLVPVRPGTGVRVGIAKGLIRNEAVDFDAPLDARILASRPGRRRKS